MLPFWKTVGQLFQRLDQELPWLSNFIPKYNTFQRGIKIYIHAKSCTRMLIKVLLLTSKMWKQEKYWSTENKWNMLYSYGRILFRNNKIWHTDTY